MSRTLIMLISGVEGNATTNDLWSALSKASGQDVHGFMVNISKASIIGLTRKPSSDDNI